MCLPPEPRGTLQQWAAAPSVYHTGKHCMAGTLEAAGGDPNIRELWGSRIHSTTESTFMRLTNVQIPVLGFDETFRP